MMAVLRNFVLACSICFAANVHALDDPWALLQKTAGAAHQLNYQGVFLYQNGSQARSVQITHMNSGGQEMTRNVVMDGSNLREVYSQGDNVIIFHPYQQKVLVERKRGQNLFPAMLPADLTLLKDSYNAAHSGGDNVAGRAAYMVELVPKDAYRYRYKIWVDAETSLLLKMTLSGAENVTLEQIGFTQLNMMGAASMDSMQPRIDMSKQYVIQNEQPVQHVANEWVVTQLPPGYRQIDHIERTVPGKSGPVNQIIFSDGIASVSLFIEPMGKGVRPKAGMKPMGSTNMCAHVVEGHQVIVVGEVPAETVRQISRSVTFKKSVSK
ncbi:MAG TPA: MucB/RseB C-terminal domain-containing protein [Methylophilus sp.]|nr:MucB/RseB C-terminal domain-containing protein [Methylophilus sp.]HQQ33543.1 MucB/RseB C-terminal domain-containing protein [Methylophilus sp.]